MPHRTRRRSGIARVPLRLVIAFILAAAALAAIAGCSDDDGVSPFHPEDGIAGTWVRDAGGGPPSIDIVIAYHDTLEIHGDRSGRWSYETPQPSGPPARSVTTVVVDVKMPFLFLHYGPCPGCETSFAAARFAIDVPPSAPRRESRIAGPAFGIVRDGQDRIELVDLHDPARPRQFFYRATP